MLWSVQDIDQLLEEDLNWQIADKPSPLPAKPCSLVFVPATRFFCVGTEEAPLIANTSRVN